MGENKNPLRTMPSRPLEFPQKDRISVIFTPADKQALRNYAEKKGQTISVCIRNLVLNAVKAT